jgi:hypothetical protein
VSNSVLMGLAALEVVGLVGLFAWVRAQTRRREAGKEPPPRLVRIAVALAGLAAAAGLPLVLILSVINPTIQSRREHDRLVKTGTPATAIITGVDETGTVYNERPEVRVSLKVQPDGAPAFRSQETWVFSVRDVQRYRIGTTVKVFFDPKDYDTVAVVGVVAPGP